MENKLRLSFATCSELAKKHKHGEHSFEVFRGIEVAAILLKPLCVRVGMSGEVGVSRITSLRFEASRFG